MAEIVLASSTLSSFMDGTSQLQIARPALSWAKRFFDIVLAGLMLLASAVAWLVIALAIKLEDGGPIFFTQERWGLLGHPFKVLKFRTMVPDSVAKYGLKMAREHDRRITRVGRLLRAMGLDELPQILSIWKGDMSFVGPRALAVGEQINDIDHRYTAYEEVPGFYRRLSVKPGLTSIATIYLPKDSSPRRKFAYDVYYIRSWSFAKDLRLVFLSFWISFSGGWEKRSRKF